MQAVTPTLEQQRQEFANRAFLANPLAGMIVWSIIGVAGLWLPDATMVGVVFAGTGSIVYLGMFISKFTGEDFMKKDKPKNEFDRLFLLTAAQAILVYSIAIPFFLVDYSSLPMTIGILSGLMWVPFSWIIKHWVGLFHTLFRTAVVLTLWYVLPEYRFVAIPFAIVATYVVTTLILANRKPVPVEPKYAVATA